MDANGSAFARPTVRQAGEDRRNKSNRTPEILPGEISPDRFSDSWPILLRLTCLRSIFLDLYSRSFVSIRGSCPFAVVSIRNVRLAFAPLLFLVRHYSFLFLHRATTWFRPPGFLLPEPQRVGARTQGNPSDDQSGMAVWAGLRRRRLRALGSTGHGAS